MGAPPFGVSVSPNGRFAFVDEAGGQLAVMSVAEFKPRLLRTISAPQLALGNSITRDGRYLLITDGSDGATVLSTKRVENGSPHAVLGTLTGSAGAGGGAIEATSSADGSFAFVSLEGAGTIAVYDLKKALAHDFSSSG